MLLLNVCPGVLVKLITFKGRAPTFVAHTKDMTTAKANVSVMNFDNFVFIVFYPLSLASSKCRGGEFVPLYALNW